jgi:hypothetical protein
MLRELGFELVVNWLLIGGGDCCARALQAPFIERFDDTLPNLAPHMREFRRQSFSRLYGFETLARFRFVWSQYRLGRYWELFMRRQSYPNPAAVVGAWGTNADVPNNQHQGVRHCLLGCVGLSAVPFLFPASVSECGRWMKLL